MPACTPSWDRNWVAASRGEASPVKRSPSSVTIWALVLLAVPPILAGVYAGISSVNPAVVDAARAEPVVAVELPVEHAARDRGAFDLHDLAVEDAHHAHQRPKLESYGDSLFLALHTAQLVGGCIQFGETHIFIGPRYLLTESRIGYRFVLPAQARAAQPVQPGVPAHQRSDVRVGREVPDHQHHGDPENPVCVTDQRFLDPKVHPFMVDR